MAWLSLIIDDHQANFLDGSVENALAQDVSLRPHKAALLIVGKFMSRKQSVRTT
jgi:hypothetical protein